MFQMSILYESHTYIFSCAYVLIYCNCKCPSKNKKKNQIFRMESFAIISKFPISKYLIGFIVIKLLS